MPNDDKSLEPRKQQPSETVSNVAQDWGSGFIKELEVHFTDEAADLPSDASWRDFRQAMIRAFVSVLRHAGAEDDEASPLLEQCTGASTNDPTREWSGERNARRLELIDKWIQKTLSPDESDELQRLTDSMRRAFDTEELFPLEGALRLHRKLLGTDDPGQAPR